MKFYDGDIVMTNSPVIRPELNHKKAEIVRWVRDTVYICKLMSTGQEILLFENELETVYAHDMKMLEIWKGISNASHP